LALVAQGSLIAPLQNSPIILAFEKGLVHEWACPGWQRAMIYLRHRSFGKPGLIPGSNAVKQAYPIKDGVYTVAIATKCAA